MNEGVDGDDGSWGIVSTTGTLTGLLKTVTEMAPDDLEASLTQLDRDLIGTPMYLKRSVTGKYIKFRTAKELYDAVNLTVPDGTVNIQYIAAVIFACTQGSLATVFGMGTKLHETEFVQAPTPYCVKVQPTFQENRFTGFSVTLVKDFILKDSEDAHAIVGKYQGRVTVLIPWKKGCHAAYEVDSTLTQLKLE